MDKKMISYKKWFEPSCLAPRAAIRMTARTGNEGEWPVHKKDGDQKGPPSGAADSISLYPFSFKVPFDTDEEGNRIPIMAKCDVTLTEDDWGEAKIDGVTVVDMTKATNEKDAGPEGGHTAWTMSGNCKVESGEHELVVTNENIEYSNPDANVAVCRYTLDVYPIEPGGEKTPEKCPCEGDACNDDGGSPSGPYSRSTRTGDGLGSFSSAGCSVQATTTETFMYWSCNFGSFRGLSGIRAGKVELRSTQTTEGMGSPAALTYHHPLASRLDVPEGGILPGTRFDLVQGARVIGMRCYNDGTVKPVGVDTSGGGIAALVTENDAPCLRWRTTSGETYLFAATSGELLSYTTKDKQNISDVSAYLDVRRAEDGSLRQLWNLWDGLLNVENMTASGYSMALYTPGQVTGTDESGFYTVTGNPFKIFLVSLSGEGRLTVTEQTPGRQYYAVTWWKNGLAWNMQKGTGEDAVTTTRIRTELENTVWQLVTETTKGETVASRTAAIYQTTDVGDLLLTLVEGYDSEMEQTTYYEYNAAGNLCKETSPDGSERTWIYDANGRVICMDEPWGADGRKKTYITYAHSSEENFSGEIAKRVVRVYPFTGKAKQLYQDTYKYAVSNHIKRTEQRTVALGGTGTRLRVTEQWLATAPNEYARGRTRMTQAVNGVQTWYDYAAAAEHGALYTETVETRVEGEAVAGKSTRNVTWITAEGQRIREENYALLDDNTWALLEGVTYVFDTQNRWITRTRDNGRAVSRELMCTGDLLSETDEDGVLTTYAYDSARQLMETTRAATDTTPETITTYTRDALGRVLATRRDIGAMSTLESFVYDLLGRTVSTTDVLGRVTSWAYSEDGLTITQTTPAGATLSTRRASDGTLLEESGTGQRHLVYFVDVVNDGLRTCTRTVSGQTEVELQRVIVNGFGETLRIGMPNTKGSMIYTRHTYNAQGQLVKMQVDAGSAATTMAPTLYEYDDFGNLARETWKLAGEPTALNSRITEYSHGMEQGDDGIYKTVTTTCNNSQGTTYTETEKQLVSFLSAVLENKTLSIDPRGNASSSWTEYTAPGRRSRKSMLPASSVTASTLMVDGFATSSVDHAGITGTASRSYTETGITYTSTDARGNTVTTKTDLAGRTVHIIDGAGNVTNTAYHPHFDQPAMVTNALGKTACFSYDQRGRKTAEYGTAVQPLLFGYDEADRITSLTTFRADVGDVTTNPVERTDGDTTTWSYHEATGLPVRKTYADGAHEDTGYNALNMRNTFTDARGITVTWGYNLKQGVNTSISYSDGTAEIQFSYNHLNQLVQVMDGAGRHDMTYNQYGELETDSTQVNGMAYHVTEKYDALSRTAGYTLKAGDAAVQEISLGYDDKGRLGDMNVAGTEMPFSWGYDAVTGLPGTVGYPNGISKLLSYEQTRNLVTGIRYVREEEVMEGMSYAYDALKRPVQRTLNQGAATRDDSFSYNDRNELIGAALGTAPYAYGYDNIGNRKTARELAEELAYEANSVNQYTSIARSTLNTSLSTLEQPFVPHYDASGNQTLVKTSTGIWTVVYNAENRPASFTSQDGTTIIECSYDYQGRRCMKKVTRGGTIVSHARYLYRGYLQIAELDMLEATPVITERYVWDPSEPAATRALLWEHRKTGGTFESCFMVHDLAKNVTAVFDSAGGRKASYDYAPYGMLISAIGELAVENKFRFSSEYADDELALVYYNYRYYNPADGRWISRDPVAEQGGWNLYGFVKNQLFLLLDSWGLEIVVVQKANETVIHGNPGGGLTYVKVSAEFTKDEPVCIKISKIEWWIVKEIPSTKNAPNPWENQFILDNLGLILREMRRYFTLSAKEQYGNDPFEWYKHVDVHESEHVKQFESVKETLNKELPEAVEKVVPELKKVYGNPEKRDKAMDELNKKWDPGFKLTTLPPKVLEELKQKYGTNDGMEWGENAATKAATEVMREAYNKLLKIYRSRNR